MVAYDYGMGGVWALALAPSEDDVVSAFPELQVFRQKPDWMTAEMESDIRSNRRFVVDDPGTYPSWLHSLIAERGQ